MILWNSIKRLGYVKDLQICIAGLYRWITGNYEQLINTWVTQKKTWLMFRQQLFILEKFEKFVGNKLCKNFWCTAYRQKRYWLIGWYFLFIIMEENNICFFPFGSKFISSQRVLKYKSKWNSNSISTKVTHQSLISDSHW